MYVCGVMKATDIHRLTGTDDVTCSPGYNEMGTQCDKKVPSHRLTWLQLLNFANR